MPPFLGLQIQTLQKHLIGDYKFTVIDDSSNSDISQNFKSICTHYGATYHRKTTKQYPPQGDPSHSPMYSCAEATQYAYDNFISKSEDIAIFLDSDMFLFKPFDPVEYMKDKEISACIQIRGHVEYLWNGIIIFNMPKVRSLKGALDFSAGMVDGEFCDVGGSTYYFIQENELKIDDLKPTFEGLYNGIQMENMETFMNETFLHFRGGTLWDQKVDVYQRKMIILDNILRTL
jgi:hypothetical protein